MTASCLEACGYAVGLYTSPHLVELSERIRINQRRVTCCELTQLLGRVAGAAESLPNALGQATHFELMTAMAFVQFAEQAVDVAVVEVGMGGRTDATNVLVPEVAAVTAIQLEHRRLLGDTLAKIAAEKAGIFKPGVPALTVPQPEEVLTVLRDTAAKAPCPLMVLGQEVDYSYRFEASPELGPHARVCVTTPRSNFEHLPVPLKGEHQAINCGLALAILDQLRAKGMDTPEGRVAAGLARTPSNGRLELVFRQPRIMTDGAHKPESVQCLVRAIGAQVRYDSMVVVFGCAADKDVSRMLSNIALGADKIIFTRAEGSQRSMDPRDLQRKFAEVSTKMTQVAPTVKEAINLAARAVNRDDLILVTGSFVVAGEAKRRLQVKQRAGADAAADAATLTEIKPLGVETPRASAKR